MLPSSVTAPANPALRMSEIYSRAPSVSGNPLATVPLDIAKLRVAVDHYRATRGCGSGVEEQLGANRWMRYGWPYNSLRPLCTWYVLCLSRSWFAWPSDNCGGLQPLWLSPRLSGEFRDQTSSKLDKDQPPHAEAPHGPNKAMRGGVIRDTITIPRAATASGHEGFDNQALWGRVFSA